VSEIQALKKALDRQRIDYYENAELKRYTTFRIGGPARLLVFPDNSRRLLPVVESAAEFGLPCKVLGMGSNVLVSDLGFDGVVIINRSTHWQIRRSESLPGSGENAADVVVRVDSGMPINRLMQTLFKEGITGLEWFAGIPMRPFLTDNPQGLSTAPIFSLSTTVADCMISVNLFCGRIFV